MNHGRQVAWFIENKALRKQPMLQPFKYCKIAFKEIQSYSYRIINSK